MIKVQLTFRLAPVARSVPPPPSSSSPSEGRVGEGQTKFSRKWTELTPLSRPTILETLALSLMFDYSLRDRQLLREIHDIIGNSPRVIYEIVARMREKCSRGHILYKTRAYS